MAKEVFGEADLAPLVFLLGIALPLGVFATNYCEGIFLSFNRYDLFVKASNPAGLLAIVPFLIAIYFRKTEGIIWGTFFTMIIMFAFFFCFV